MITYGETGGLAARLPRLPQEDDQVQGGYAWIDALTGGWCEVGVWGREGWDLGAWPYVVIAHYDAEDGSVHGLAQYCEGDITVHAYALRDDRDAKTDEIALFHWRTLGNGPANVPGEDAPAEQVAAFLREVGGPYRET